MARRKVFRLKGLNIYAAYHVLYGGVDPSGAITVNDKAVQNSIDNEIKASRIGSAMVSEIEALEEKLGVEVTIDVSTDSGSKVTSSYGDPDESSVSTLVSIEIIINPLDSKHGCYITGDGPNDFAESGYDEILFEELYHALQNLRLPIKHEKALSKLGLFPKSVQDSIDTVNSDPNLTEEEKSKKELEIQTQFWSTWKDYFEWEANMEVNRYRQWKSRTGKGNCPDRTFYGMYKTEAQLVLIAKRLQGRIDAGDGTAYQYWETYVDAETKQFFEDHYGVTVNGQQE
jgi:hypothetical protein